MLNPFGEDVRKLARGANMRGANKTNKDSITNNIKVDLKVLGVLMKGGVVHDETSA